jgi:hypothetical protein
VLIRDIRLPPFIVKAIEAKKEREQQVEKLGEDPRPGRP